MKLIRILLGVGCFVLAGSVAAQSMAIAWDLYMFSRATSKRPKR